MYNLCMADKLDQLFEIMHVKVFCYDRLLNDLQFTYKEV